MSDGVLSCLLGSHGVSWCLMMPEAVLIWLMVSHGVSRSLNISHGVSWCLYQVLICLMVSHFVLGCSLVVFHCDESWCLSMSHVV